MSLPGPVALTATHPLLRWRRDYAGTVLTVGFADHPPLQITPGQPVLTHAGWVRPGLLVAGMRVVLTDTGFGQDAEIGYRITAAARGEHRLPTLPTDFRGDGGGGEAYVTCPDRDAWPPQRPWAGNEGHPPAVDPAAVRGVLDALCTLAEFRVARWEQACAMVPGLAAAYPDGPVIHHDGLDAGAEARLGYALGVLPAPPVQREALGARLLGLPVPLRLGEIISITSEPSTTIVHDVITAAGVMLADGVVVAA